MDKQKEPAEEEEINVIFKADLDEDQKIIPGSTRPVNQTILQEAEQVIKNRMEQYGKPVDNHFTTSNFWTSYLCGRDNSRKGPLPLTSIDICMLNILQKISRIANGVVTRDALIDIAGYARNAEIILAEQEEVSE